MEGPNEQIKDIKVKIRNLTRHYQQLKIENEQLIGRNDQLNKDMNDRDKKIADIQNKNINLQISRALEKGGTEKSTGFKQMLDEYIMEIESVIAHLKD
jgi:predicted nuclease with TOPRIM domain